MQLQKFFNCFDFLGRIRRNTFDSVEGTSDEISFLFCENIRLSMDRYFCQFLVDFAVVFVEIQ